MSDNLQVSKGTRLSSMSSDYIVEDLAGSGTFGQVARCLKTATNETVAVKIMNRHFAFQAEEEEAILRQLKDTHPDRHNIVKWECSFTYKEHLCQEFELLDMNLHEFLEQTEEGVLQLKEIRPIIHQVAMALAALKDREIVHSDVKPENIMLVDHIQQPLKIKMIDFGSAFHASEAQQGSYIQTRWYRAPETILGLPFNEAVDMWSLGCIAAELFLGSALFPGNCEYDMIWKITETQGELPKHLLNAGHKTDRFYQWSKPDIWRLATPEEYGITWWNECMVSSLDDLKDFHQSLFNCPTEADRQADEADLNNFVDLMKQMLKLDPAERITPIQVLQHPFITMSHLTGYLESSSHVKSCFDLMGICSPQNPNQAENQTSFQGLPSGGRVSTSFSNGNPHLQNLPSLFKEDKSDKIHIKPSLKRKMEDDNPIQKHDRSQYQVRKKRKVSGERPAVKRPKKCDEKYSPSSLKGRKRKISEERPNSQIPTCSNDNSKVFPQKRKRVKITTDKEEKDLTMSPSTSKDIPSVVIRVKAPKRKASRSPSDDRKTENRPRKKKRTEDEKVTKIWIIGSSYIKRGEGSAHKNFGENFGLNAQVQWFGKGGMRWSDVLPRFYDELSTQSPPDILVVHAGGNDLGLKSVRELVSQMKGDLMQLHEEFPSMTITYSCINERKAWRNGKPKWIDKDRKTVNRRMRKAAGCFNGEVIEHPFLTYSDDSVFLSDGVHFTRKGNEIFVTSIRTVIEKILQKPAPRRRT